MSGAQFTLGPWYTSESKKSVNATYFVTMPDGERKQGAMRVATLSYNSNYEADANLIAAAPDLYAACEAVLASAMRNEAYDICHAAVAKAQGEIETRQAGGHDGNRD